MLIKNEIKTVLEVEFDATVLGQNDPQRKIFSDFEIYNHFTTNNITCKKILKTVVGALVV